MPQMDLPQAQDQLRFALNELKAIGTGQERPSDRRRCATRLRNLAAHVEAGGWLGPGLKDLFRDAATLPIQA